MPVFASTDGSVLVTCEYNDDVYGEPGKTWVILHDNPILGWSDTAPVTPVIIGSMPADAPATDPILSPTWAQYVNGMLFVPDMWRGGPAEFFTLVAGNNGATRKVYANFYTPALASAFNQWAQTHPAALTEPPNVPPDDEAEAEAEGEVGTEGTTGRRGGRRTREDREREAREREAGIEPRREA